ncbi:MAG: peptide-methionine (S)-S-oxide reductase MsrA [Xanthomonadales bacterium]|nr:peptide-methionine (S)-S-oxide reductase MsrA [Xanthomonadales bacterium]
MDHGPAAAESAVHAVLGTPLAGPWPEGARLAWFAMGCFWGAERRFWVLPGVIATAVGYLGGQLPNPDYRTVCTGLTGHAETVQVVYDPGRIGYAELLRRFWEGHDPTQGLRQGADVGPQYRSLIACADEAQHRLARLSLLRYQEALTAAGYGPITTEILFPAPRFWYAEPEHQQYLARHPRGDCGLGGTGVACPPLPAA